MIRTVNDLERHYRNGALPRSSATKGLRDQGVPTLDTPPPSIKSGKISTAGLIAETAHVVAIHQPGEGDVLYITFNSANEVARGLGFSGGHVLRRHGRPAIGIMSTAANWFPKAAMAKVLAAAQAIIAEHGFRQVVCFGHGMGGYGALRFAAELQADVAIALSPITTIDPGQTSVPNKFWARIDPDLRVWNGSGAADKFIVNEPSAGDVDWVRLISR